MKLVPLSTVFDVTYPSSLVFGEHKDSPGPHPFVSSTGVNNGIAGYVSPIEGAKLYPAGAITVPLKGTVFAAHLQPVEFYCAHQIAVLTARSPMSVKALMYYVTAIRANMYRYSYGRQADRTIRALLIPALSDLPDWISSDGEIKPGNYLPGVDNASFTLREPSVARIDASAWKPFRYEQLFEIKKGRRLTKDEMTCGTTLFVGATESNNGVTARIGQDALHPGGQLTVSYNGSVAEAFYQPEPFWASDDVNVLYPRFAMTRELGLFLATLIRLEKYRYNYGRKWGLEVMKRSTLLLPVDTAGAPDWAEMEAIVRACPSARLLTELH